MYHLIVKFVGWDPPQGELSRERFLELTDDRIAAEIAPDDRVVAEKILPLPAVFATETQGSGEPGARVGYITEVKDSGHLIRFRFSYDPEIPRIECDELAILATELDIRQYEMNRTHWAIKDVDLFHALYMKSRRDVPRPKIFSVPRVPSNPTVVSVMMPFRSELDGVYSAIKSASESNDFECRRVDDIWEDDVIMNDIVSLIARAAVVVSDCTDKNPNVFYETGIAHSLGRPVILIAQHAQDVPFDLQHLRYVLYLNNAEGLLELEKELHNRIRTLIQGNA